MKRCLTIIYVIIGLGLAIQPAIAGPDRFFGDSAIYTGEASHLRPKILLIIDNSNASKEEASGSAYDKNHDYYNDVPAGITKFPRYAVYRVPQQGIEQVSANDRVGPDNPANMDYITCTYVKDGETKYVKDNLSGTDGTLGGSYSGSATVANPNLKKGTGANADKTVCDTSGQGATFVTGNFLNWNNVPPQAVLVVGTDGKDYKLIANHTSSADNRPISGANWTTYWQDNGTTGQGAVWQSGLSYNLGSDSQRKIMYDAITTIVGGARFAANFGAMIYDDTGNKGGKVIYQVSDLTSDANFNAFKASLPGPGNNDGPAVLSSQTARPQAEALLDAGYYFRGQALPISGGNAMASPLQYDCEYGYVILITNGLSNKDNDPKLGTIVGDYDNDGRNELQYGLGSHYLDDVAKYLYDTDAGPNLAGTQRIKTHTVLAFQAADSLVTRTADSGHGHGTFHNVWNAPELATAILDVINSILLEVNTSFVAPVVPISPENKTYSGSRLYMGLFKPISEKPWLGNIKKLGITNDGVIIDRAGNEALNSDGSIKTTAKSFWVPSGTDPAGDGAVVDSGGVGALLSPNSRNIYTYTGTNASLTDSSNAFTDSNGAITYSTLDVADATTKNQLVNFVRGKDSYDDDGDSNSTEARSWMLGDVLHSRPLVVNYASYTFTDANEANCSVNKALIFVGTNDGMLHAFKDCDGSEAWAFIPPDLLPNLKYLRESSHAYFVDSTAVPYIYDANGNGAIESGDKVIIMFGERRGGGKNSAPTGGSYYALDVTDPAAPVLLFRISNTLKQKGTTSTATTDYSEMGETWSEPKLVKVKIGTTTKIAAFIGAGYDNLNEDSRYGATQTFPSSPSPDDGSGTVTSSGTSSPSNPKGRGIYAVEVASLNSSGVPSFTNSGDKLWGYTYSDNTDMAFSIPSEVAAIDTNVDGYADTIYVGDTGGNIWMFNVSATSTSSWTGTKIFSANPSSGSTAGKKMFYKPSVTAETGYYMLYFGTGDREHPLNRNVVDRMYAVKDSGQTTAKTESDLTDVTDNNLQDASSTTTQVTNILNALSASSGWRIDLDQNSGEKVLAPATVFNQTVYYTTYAPNTASAADPCSPGNLGTARVYVLNYKTGEAVINFYAGNDGSGNSNTRSSDSSGNTLEREDRVMTAGTGIPSGVVIIVGQGGESKLMMSVGGSTTGDGAVLFDPGKKSYKYIKPLYWRQR